MIGVNIHTTKQGKVWCWSVSTVDTNINTADGYGYAGFYRCGKSKTTKAMLAAVKESELLAKQAAGFIKHISLDH